MLDTMTLDKIDEKDFLSFCSTKLLLGKGSFKNLPFDLRYLKRWLNGEMLTKETFESFLATRKDEGISHSYLNKFIHLIKYLDKYVKDRGLGELSFIWEFKAYRIQRPPFEILSNEQIEALYNTHIQYGKYHFKDTTEELNFLHITILMLLSQTGCRISEMQDLQVKDFDPEQGWVRFLETKNGTHRKNFIYDPLISRMLSLVKGKNSNDLIFTNAAGSRIVGQDFNQDLKKRCEQTGIIPKWKEIHTHTFRHSLIVELLTQGVPMALVASWVGHADIQSTNYYYKSLDSHLKDTIAHHRLIRSKIEPDKLIAQMQQTFEAYNLQQDKRFGFKMEKGDNSFNLTVYIK